MKKTTEANKIKTEEIKIKVTFPGARALDSYGTSTKMKDEVVELTTEQYLNMEKWMN